MDLERILPGVFIVATTHLVLFVLYAIWQLTRTLPDQNRDVEIVRDAAGKPVTVRFHDERNTEFCRIPPGTTEKDAAVLTAEPRDLPAWTEESEREWNKMKEELQRQVELGNVKNVAVSKNALAESFETAKSTSNLDRHHREVAEKYAQLNPPPQVRSDQ